MLLGWLHTVYGNRPEVHALLRGVSPVVAGLIFSTATKMALGPRLRSWLAIFPVLSFCAVVWARLPLATVLGICLPLSIAAAWLRERQMDRTGEART
jgi:chromate transport protein ChrA